MKDDRLTGVRSAALSLGRHLRFGVGVCYLFASLLWAAGFFSLLGQGAWMGDLALSAVIFYGSYGGWLQMTRQPHFRFLNPIGMAYSNS